MTLSHTEIAQEHDRRTRHCAVILRMLQQAGDQGVTNQQMADTVTHRFGGRIHDLRREGHVIDKEHLGGGLWVYRLVQEITPANAHQGTLFGGMA